MEQKQKIERERVRLLVQLDRFLDVPMVILGVVWLILLLVDLLGTTTPAMERATWVLWGIFVVEYLLKLAIAPAKVAGR